MVSRDICKECGGWLNGQIIWCRPRIVDEPIQATYIRQITKEENRIHGYRYGHLVEINERETWVRLDLCGTDKDKIAIVSGSGY